MKRLLAFLLLLPGSTANGTAVRLGTCTHATTQQWTRN